MKNRCISLLPAMEDGDIKEVFKRLVETGRFKCKITGPKDNILDCETDEDWVRASHYLFDAGFTGVSPGTLGSSPAQRASLYQKMYRSGTVHAVVIKSRILVWRVATESDYCLVMKKQA